MPRSTARAARPLRRGGGVDRHGRGLRSSATGPHLAPLRTRIDFFDDCVASAVDYLRELWPDELAHVHVHVADDGPRTVHAEGVDRWGVDRRSLAIVLYRLPIQRLAHLHKDDDWHRRSYIESCVFRAVAELLGKDPWDIAPERYRHF